MNEITILLADDERGIRKYCQEELEAEGFRVILAEDGDDALAILEQLVVDLVVLDQHMPRCDGLQAAKHIKQLDASLPVILFTADQHYDRYANSSIDACVLKTEDLGQLKEKINELLRATRGEALER